MIQATYIAKRKEVIFKKSGNLELDRFVEEDLVKRVDYRWDANKAFNPCASSLNNSFQYIVSNNVVYINCYNPDYPSRVGFLYLAEIKKKYSKHRLIDSEFETFISQKMVKFCSCS